MGVGGQIWISTDNLAPHPYRATWEVLLGSLFKSLLSGCKKCSWLAVSNYNAWICKQTLHSSWAFCWFLREECGRGTTFGIFAHSESPIVGYFAPKPPWPDRNLADHYLSLRLSLFFEGRSGLQPEGFVLLDKNLTLLTPVQSLLPRDTTYNHS